VSPKSSLVAGIATGEQVHALEKLVEQQRLLQCEKILIGIICNRASENYLVCAVL